MFKAEKTSMRLEVNSLFSYRCWELLISRPFYQSMLALSFPRLEVEATSETLEEENNITSLTCTWLEYM
jgi:hypothetical protein